MIASVNKIQNQLCIFQINRNFSGYVYLYRVHFIIAGLQVSMLKFALQIELVQIILTLKYKGADVE